MCEDRDKPYDVQRLQDRVRPMKLQHAQVVSSTNDWAKRDAQSEFTPAPALFVAETQSAGRGRGRNTWWSAVGNVTATFVVPQNPRIAFGLVPLLAGLAVRRTLVRLTGCDQIRLKWPNDLVVGRRKLAGLLCERLRHVDLIGVGINVNVGSQESPVELREQITSLRELTGQSWDRTNVVSELSQDVNRVLSVESAQAASEMLQEYSLNHWPTGKNVEVVDTDDALRITGRCVGIDSQGQLLVKTEAGSHRLLTGSIASVTPATDW